MAIAIVKRLKEKIMYNKPMKNNSNNTNITVIENNFYFSLNYFDKIA